MNVAESMKHVLKNQSQALFTNFWKDDLKVILLEMKSDVRKLVSEGPSRFKSLKKKGFKNTITDVFEATVDTVTVFRLIPKRLKQGFQFFREDFLEELEKLEDQKLKTMFSLKVIGALSSFAVGAFYGFKKSQTDISFKGLRRKGAFTQYIVMELVFRVSHLFILRFINEIEKNITDQDESKKLKYFKRMLSDPKNVKPENGIEPSLEVDKSFEIVEDLKNYVITGERNTRRNS